MSKRKGGHRYVATGSLPKVGVEPTAAPVRHIGHAPTRLVRVAVREFANGQHPVGVVSLVVPADLPTAQVIERALDIIRRDKGVPGMALTGSVVAA